MLYLKNFFPTCMFITLSCFFCTFILQTAFPFSFFVVAVIIAVPVFFAFTFPFLSTDATFLLEDFHVIPACVFILPLTFTAAYSLLDVLQTKFLPHMFILRASSSNCPTLHSHNLQTTFPLHQYYALHNIHQMHCNRKFDP